MKNIKYISASAGSGKTYTLTKTLAEAIKKGDVEPENVILTTFTKVAAAEFKEKAKEMLYGQGLIEEADRLDQALIGTIHSVAKAFIQKYWYILGLSPKINAIAENDLEFFKNQSLLNLLEEEELSFLNAFAEEFSIKKLMSTRIDYDFWKTDLWRILEFSKNYGITDYAASIGYSKDVTASLVEAFHHIKVDKDALEDILNKAKVLNEAHDSENQQKIRFRINSWQRNLPEADSSSFKYAKESLALLEELPWDELLDDKNAFAESLGNLYSSEEVRNLLNKYIDLMFALAARWAGQYSDYKKEHHLIDFSDMETYFCALLDNDEVAADIKASYKYVFVDEFQDCSPMQVKIFSKLSDIVEHSVWVGDKKQAIYAFRGSDTELTSAVMDEIKENEKRGLNSCSTDFLDKSWRSLPAIVGFTNAVFAYGFGKTDAEGRREVCLEAQRKDGEGQVGFWWIVDGKKEDRIKTLARNIISLINGGEKTSDIAVLARKNDELRDVAAALREYKVPVYIDEDGLSGADTVSLVSSLLQLVADETAELPKAQIAFLTEADYKLGKILDDKIAFNAAAKNKSPYYNEIPLVKKILEGRSKYKNQSLSAMVESIIIELDLYSLAKKLNDAADTTKLLHAIIDSAAEYEAHCELMHLPVSIMGFVTYLGEQGLSVSGSTDGVQFFTYHKSKGLEWKNVIILGCEKDFLEEKALIKHNFFGTQLVKLPQAAGDKLNPEVRISLLPNLFSGNSKIAAEWMNKILGGERYGYMVMKEIEEMKRLMYVAMTRPRDRLILALNGKGRNPKPLVAFQKMGFCVPSKFDDSPCDLFGVGFPVNRLPSAEPEIQYSCEQAADTILCISAESKKVLPLRDLQPSGFQGGKVDAEICASISPVSLEGSYDSAALGTCIHDIFCVAELKSEAEIAEMVKSRGFEKNIPRCGEIKKSWSELTKFLCERYGKAGKQFHEMAFKYQASSSQIMTGSMDFVWECADGLVLVDFKTFPGRKEDLLDENGRYYVGKYKGQLECYRNALESAGKKVIASLLFYPVVGVIVKL